MDDIQTEQTQTSPTIEPIRFRAGKKRKAYRQKAPAAEEAEHGNDGVATAISPTPVVPSSNLNVDTGRDADDTGAEAQNPTQGDSEREEDDDDNNHTTEESAVAAALRLRNARRAASRRGGVGFRSEGRSAPGEEDDSENALVLRDQDKEAVAAHDRIVGGITNRFMHQTGLLTILDDSHMNAYIESRLASRNAANVPQGGASSSNSQLPPHASAQFQNDNGNPADKYRDQPTRHGKLVEVDTTNLGNHQMNNDSKRRRVDTDTAKPAPQRRGRNRRNSEDIARDAMVEQFLSENRLDVYEVPKTHSTSTAAAASSSSYVPGADPSADDRLAEQFRQQYYDEMALRRKRKRPAPTQQQKQQQQSADVLKGPKLGGSRNQRAAVRNILLQQEKDKKGK
ncbi:hypothetical protein TGAM01_v203722 [Trichoderma gamsii]|uniref:Uncharacterized protein n=1 Tax=Trichoderma gamsii TaxID=398673 RepID=A0A2P4ZST4_9HYPO|nr:hypothetical protein TGAM01_v203722 [Trichoderma gamsii]PON27341.1 hypothetical protein TGAM01_v203722 [Trichoderma gamsii]